MFLLAVLLFLKPLIEIYGIIKIIDDGGNTTEIFSRGYEAPEVVTVSGKLSLTCVPIFPSVNMPVEVNLKIIDKDCDAELAKGNSPLNCFGMSQYDQVIPIQFQGKHGFVIMDYTPCQYAVVANVEAELVAKAKNDRSVTCVPHLYGTIVAYCLSRSEKIITETASPVGFEDHTKNVVLFEKQSDEGKSMQFGDPIELSRPGVAVPVYSSVFVKVDLWDSVNKCPLGNKCVEF